MNNAEMEPMIEFCEICGVARFLRSDVPTREPQRVHHACYTATARWFDRRPAPGNPYPSDDRLLRMERERKNAWRRPVADQPDLRRVL